MHFNVLIATPGQSMTSGYVKSLMETANVLNNKNISFKFLNAYSSLVHNARELTISGGTLNVDDNGPLGGSVTYDKVFWIDSDIEWTPDQFLKLYESDLDIVSGAYILADGNLTTVHTKEYLMGIPKDIVKKLRGVIKVQSVGFGFVAIKNGVFEKLERPWFGHYSQFMENSNGQKIPISLGEDVSWCIRAANAGFDINFDTSVLVNHIKTQIISW